MMVDGPFKNAALPERWKKFGDSLTSNAVSSAERVQQAESAIFRDLCTKETRDLVSDVLEYVNRQQGDLIPRMGIDAIFDKHAKTPQADILYRHITTNLARQMPLLPAWNNAFDSFVRHEAYGTRNRIHEECLHARDRGDLVGAKFSRAVRRAAETFDKVNVSRIRDDLLSGKSKAAAAIPKSTGLDDGVLPF
jgi:hypothetical protein